jgi:multidrug resistance efflux pump
LSPRVLTAQAALRTAQEKVRAAEAVFRNSYVRTNNADYLAAQAEVDAADKLVEDAKRRSDGFGQPLIDATEQRKKAQEKAARIVNDAMAGDPAVASSRRDLAGAEESLRQANAAARGK